jgi:hypothetical protein
MKSESPKSKFPSVLNDELKGGEGRCRYLIRDSILALRRERPRENSKGRSFTVILFN